MAVTTQKTINYKGDGLLWAFPVKTGETIYGGTLAAIGADGYLYNMDSTAAKEARVICVVADESANETGPAATTASGSISGSLEISSAVAGDKTVRNVYISGYVQLTFTSIAQSDVGKVVYATDNYTLDETMNGGVKVGTLITYISATSGWIALNTYMQSDGTVFYKGALTKATVTDAGAVLTWANPTGETIMVTDFIIDITAASTTAGTTLDIGIGTATASRDTLLDGINVATLAPRVACNVVQGGTNGGMDKATTAESIVGTASAALTASFAGTYAIGYRFWE